MNYSNEIHPKIAKTFEHVKQTFPGNVAILSNSAGSPLDTDGSMASTTEDSLGIPVIKHKYQKPECAGEVC